MTTMTMMLSGRVGASAAASGPGRPAEEEDDDEDWSCGLSGRAPTREAASASVSVHDRAASGPRRRRDVPAEVGEVPPCDQCAGGDGPSAEMAAKGVREPRHLGHVGGRIRDGSAAATAMTTAPRSGRRRRRKRPRGEAAATGRPTLKTRIAATATLVCLLSGGFSRRRTLAMEADPSGGDGGGALRRAPLGASENLSLGPGVPERLREEEVVVEEEETDQIELDTASAEQSHSRPPLHWQALTQQKPEPRRRLEQRRSVPGSMPPPPPLRDHTLYDDLSAAYRSAYAFASSSEGNGEAVLGGLVKPGDIMSREGNLDVLHPNPGLRMGGEDSGTKEGEGVGVGVGVGGRGQPLTEDLAICHLTAMWRYSTLEGDLEDPDNTNARSLGPAFYGDSAGALLAVHHFNHGLGHVVRELDGIDKRCNVRLTAEFFDSYSSQRKTVFQATELMRRRLPEPHPCAVLGAFRSAVSTPLSVLTGVYDLPQLSPVSSSPDLDNQNLHPLFSRMVPSDAGTSLLYVRFVMELGVRHVGCLYVNDAYGIGYHRAFKRIAENNDLVIKCHSINFKPSREEISDALADLAKTNFNYFFSMTFGPEHYDLIMEEAYHRGIAGNSNKVTSWVFAGGNQRWVQNVRYPAGSPLHLATLGTGYIQADGGMEGMAGFDRFMKSWRSLDADDVSYFNSKQPPDHITAEAEYFKVHDPERETVFAYDAVVALGLAACNITNSRREASDDGPPSFSGQDHFDAFVKTTFHGATGLIRIDPETTSRDPVSALFVIFNAVARPPDGDGMVSFEVAPSIIHVPVEEGTSSSNTNDTNSGARWTGVDGSSFIWADGSKTPPPPLPRWDHDYNHYGAGLRSLGITLSAIAMVLSAGFAVWTWCNRMKRVVLASQPIFLGLICVGTLTMGSAIIPLSIDESVTSQEGASIACMCIPWLYCCGFVLAFSALFSKTWRVNKIFSAPKFRRIAVTTKDVIWPLVIFMAMNIIVLLVWTVVSPLSYARIEREGRDPFGRTMESYGTCLADGATSRLPYFVALAVINLCPLLVSNYQAYKCRKLQTEFSETTYIAVAMASVLQASIIGIPVFAIVADDPQARFLVATALIFVQCMAMLLLIFVPKVVANKHGVMRTSISQQIHKSLFKSNIEVRGDQGSIGRPGRSGSATSVKSEPYRNSFGAIRPSFKREISDHLEGSSDVFNNDELCDSDGSGRRSGSVVRWALSPESEELVTFKSQEDDGSHSSAHEETKTTFSQDSQTEACDDKNRESDETLRAIFAVASEEARATESCTGSAPEASPKPSCRRHSTGDYVSESDSSISRNSDMVEGLRFFLEEDKIRSLEERIQEKDEILLRVYSLLMATKGKHIRRSDLDEVFHCAPENKQRKRKSRKVLIRKDKNTDKDSQMNRDEGFRQSGASAHTTGW